MTLDERIGAAASAYVQMVAENVRTFIGDDLEGVWLTGSGALGDFDPARSDLDVQAIAGHLLPLERRRELADALSAHAARACPVRGIEFVLYARESLLTPAGPEFQLNLNTGPGMEHHVAYDPGADPRFWFVVDVAIARQKAIPLDGGAPASAFPEQPRRLVLEALRAALEWYAEHGGSPAQTVLGACRTWAWASDGTWRSKGASARWARAGLTDPTPVEKALRLRDDPAAQPLSSAEVDVVLARARQALSGDG